MHYFGCINHDDCNKILIIQIETGNNCINYRDYGYITSTKPSLCTINDCYYSFYNSSKINNYLSFTESQFNASSTSYNINWYLVNYVLKGILHLFFGNLALLLYYIKPLNI